jgi:hypothetical protein
MSGSNSRPTANIDAAWMKSDLAGVERAMQEYASEDEVVVSMRVQNAHTHPVTFFLEPWAEEVIMPPGSSVWVFACGPKVSETQDKLHFECSDEWITVYSSCMAYAVAVE